MNGTTQQTIVQALRTRILSGKFAPGERLVEAQLREGDAIFAAGSLDSEGETRYAAMNGRFHALIVEAAHNLAVSTALALNDKIPFVAPGKVVFDKTAQERQFMMLSYAHRQHHAIVGALVNGEGVRVEALMKEHTHISKESLNLPVDRLHLSAVKAAVAA